MWKVFHDNLLSLPSSLVSFQVSSLSWMLCSIQHSWKLTVLIYDVIPSLLWAFYPFFSQGTSLPYPLIIPIYPFSFISAIREFIQNGSVYIKLKIGKTNLCFRARTLATSWGLGAVGSNWEGTRVGLLGCCVFLDLGATSTGLFQFLKMHQIIQ